VQTKNFRILNSHFIHSIVGTLFIFISLLPQLKVNAQNNGIIWGKPFNISRTPNATSTDPFLLSDPAGVVHLFWAEKVSNQPANNPDTLLYTQWDGSNWSEPIDIYIAPEEHGNQIAQYPHAALDDQGVIHLIWLSQPNFPNYALFYSTAPANQANFAQAWEPVTILADDLTGTNYGLDIKVDSDQNIHIVYSRVQGGSEAPELRAVSYLKSEDAGKTWSDSMDIYTVSDPLSGASNNRLIVDNQGNLYTTWSEWNQSGNGQAIYFSRSLDNGESWEKPITLTKRVGSEYERDWNSIALLEPDTLVSIWEGGWRAYRNIMYSYDGGVTWTEPVDAFPGVIGENGFVEFARDSENTLHMFFANRTREGNSIKTGEGLWHSVWLGKENWSEPILSSPNINMLNPKAVIVNGNQVVVTWYVGKDNEIMVMTGEIPNIASIPQKTSLSSPTEVPLTPPQTLSYTNTQATPNMSQITENNDTKPNSTVINLDQTPTNKPSAGLIAGVGLSLIAIIGFASIKKFIFHK